VLHHRRLPALQERRHGIARKCDRHVETACVAGFDRGEIAVGLHEQHQRHGRNVEPGSLARVGNQAIARPGFAREQVIDSSSKRLGGKGHRVRKEKPAQTGRPRGFLL